MNATQTKASLTYTLVERKDILAKDVKRMFTLMECNYDHVSRQQFEADLDKKQWVGVVRDPEYKLQGFTTFSVNPGGSGTEEYNILYSGDTIVSPDYWGSLEFIKGSVSTGGSLIASNPDKKWYWFLISKGHRTYMYLPLFFHSYFPSTNHKDAETLFPILDRTARRLFGQCWKADKGLIIFPNSMGQLKPELAASTWEKKHKAPVAFFLEKNPGFYMGHELACLTEASAENMKGIAKRFFLEGAKNPIQLP